MGRVDVGRVAMSGVGVAGVRVPGAMLDVDAVRVTVAMGMAVMTEAVGKPHGGHHDQPQKTRDQENRIDQRRASASAAS
jgi:hypothetical protein